MMSKIPVIAIFDIGKSNKKLFLFDENYHVVFERSTQLAQITDENGDSCEDLNALRNFVLTLIAEIFQLTEYEVKAINFSAYGASLVYVDDLGEPVAPLYNYLKPYPHELADQFYQKYGPPEKFAKETASPLLGSLNSGLQLFRYAQEQPARALKTEYALHLPQYLSSLVTNRFVSDITSLGCHTAMWNFDQMAYHRWLAEEDVSQFLPSLVGSDSVVKIRKEEQQDAVAGAGLHDSSAALIPYLLSFHEPFLLISTGTWCISLNPFNDSPLTMEELEQDCLSYLSYQGKKVKASRLFAGMEHEQQLNRIASHFKTEVRTLHNMGIDYRIVNRLNGQVNNSLDLRRGFNFRNTDLNIFSDAKEAYHQLMIDIIALQQLSTKLIIGQNRISRIFVDGGFSSNAIYMNLLAAAFPEMEVFAASMAQASALGAALAIHRHWNGGPIPGNLIDLKYYSSGKTNS